jgi:hypothetical protein
MFTLVLADFCLFLAVFSPFLRVNIQCMNANKHLLKKNKPCTAHVGFRADEDLKAEIIKIETEFGYKRSEILRQVFRLGFPRFKKMIKAV